MRPDNSAEADAFACRQVTLPLVRRGYDLSLSLYDASYRDLSDSIPNNGPYQLWGKPLSSPPPHRGLVVTQNDPWVQVSEKGDYHLVAEVRGLSVSTGSTHHPSKATVLFWPELRAAGLCQDDPATAHSPTQRSARLRLQGIVGRVRVEIRVGGVALLTLPLLVVPYKLDYASDLQRLLQELSAVAATLALRSQGSAQLQVSPRASSPSPLERLITLQALLHPSWLPRALSIIARSPHQELHTQGESVERHNFYKTRQDDLTRALVTHGQSSAERLYLLQRATTFDTPENRFVMQLWRRVQREAKEVARCFQRAPEIAAHARTLARLAVRLPPPLLLAHTQRPTVSASPSLWLRRRAGYREVWLARRLLGRDLPAHIAPTQPTTLEAPGRTLPLLYESWCLLVLTRCLQRLTHAKTSPSLSLRPDGVLRFPTGQRQTIAPGITLGYQMSFKALRASSLQLRPDFVVELFGVALVFDAKYRLSDDADGPQHQDLLTAHAYKDALQVDGSFVLYPGHGDPVLHQQSPPGVLPAVGAFPLRPGAAMADGEAALFDFLQRCMQAQPMTQTIRKAAEERAPYGVVGALDEDEG